MGYTLIVVTSIETVLEALNRAGIRYLVVGGVALDRTTAPVIGLQDLINLKQKAGRPRDLEDVVALNTLAESADDRQN